MNALEILLWVVVPYVSLAIFVVGHYWRYKYDKFGWTTRSSQLYERRLLRWGSPLFHFGILFGARSARCSPRPRRTTSSCTSCSPRRSSSG